MDNEQIERLGGAAKQLLESEAFRIVFEDIRADCYRNWVSSDPENQILREDMYYLTVSLAHVEAKLRGFVDNAKVQKSRADAPKLRVVPANEGGE